MKCYSWEVVTDDLFNNASDGKYLFPSPSFRSKTVLVKTKEGFHVAADAVKQHPVEKLGNNRDH